MDKFFKLCDPGECPRSPRVGPSGWGFLAEELSAVLLPGCGCFGGRLEAKFGEIFPFLCLAYPLSFYVPGIRIIGGLVAFINDVMDCSYLFLVRDKGPTWHFYGEKNVFFAGWNCGTSGWPSFSVRSLALRVLDQSYIGSS